MCVTKCSPEYEKLHLIFDISRALFAVFSRTSKSVIATDEVNFITTATELCVFTLPVCNVPQA